MVTSELNTPTASAFDLKSHLSARAALVEAALDKALPVVYPETLYESMRYSLMAGGKRLRPVLCLAACELAGGSLDLSMPTACALEMVHTMSLIHDDLPAMDDDDYRRGQPSNHKVYGEDVAVLTGDGLLAYAFEYIATQTPQKTEFNTAGASAIHILKVIANLGRAVGANGLVGGQIVDLDSEGKDISEETLTYIHRHKTAALLEVSVTSGAVLAGAEEALVQRLERYAQHIGLAFQIVDDILDITSTSEALGKSAGKDIAVAKATYPRLWGLEESKRRADQLIEAAIAELDTFGDKALPLIAIAQYITARTH